MSDDITLDSQALHHYVDRVLELHTERKALNKEITSVYEEAKNAGMVPAIIRQIVKETQMEREARIAQYGLMNNYRRAMGLLGELPDVPQNPNGEAQWPRPFSQQPMGRRRRGEELEMFEGGEQPA